ncbi:AAA family ATPase [Colletotrichum tofieldiae]|nr:AAA family ATPase [Colletotrichum tofieldiae]
MSLARRDYHESALEKARKRLTDFHLQLMDSTVDGYDLKEKTWKNFEVDRISDIKWNTKPFESLVLPDGYKEFILAFVESQVRDKEAFDDLINGKVAEKIQAPLFKMELADYDEDENRRDRDDREPESPRPRDSTRSMDFTTAFSLAARLGAVLLIDECDMYLEKRSDASSKRNRMVSRFLKELEYYPSLLFLTTNRERSLDPAIYSRIHLTINYPALDKPSRLLIWRTFLEKNGSVISEADFEALSNIEVNGRRIRNIVKTAGIMAKREKRKIGFGDVKKVMRITEGIEVEGLNKTEVKKCF